MILNRSKILNLQRQMKTGSKEYRVEIGGNTDIRKDIFSKCAKSDIVILEMKKEESSLEEAFIKIVEDRPEYTQKEIKKMQYEKEIEELREEEKRKKEKKETKKKEKTVKKESSNNKKSNNKGGSKK